jgi:Zn-dependent peptidase ImmA (M78 family)/DNA-binding XRE family transcriptional regulator
MPDLFNPEMVTVAREARRMTQKALALASGVSQGTISKIENGQHHPSTETVDALARAVGFPASLFSRDASVTVQPGLFFRKRASFPVTSARSIDANIKLERHRLGILLRSAETPAIRVPDVGTSPTRSAADIARELRAAWGVRHGPIANLTELLEDSGVIVVATDLDEGLFGLSTWERAHGVPPTMFVNARGPADRVRFTAAHELGHLVMHHHQIIPPEDCEDEADRFAAEFLMPEADIRHELASLTIDRLVELKLRWRVSMQAVLKRASDLGRITPSRSRMLWRQLSAAGYRKKEPVTIAGEEPTLLAELVRVHTEDLEYSVEELAAAVDMTPDDLAAKYLGQRRGLRVIVGGADRSSGPSGRPW